MYLLLFLLFGVCTCHHTILFNTQKDLRTATISKGKKPVTHTIVKDLQDVSVISYIHNASLVCWISDVSPQIECASFDGSHAWNRTVYAKMVPAGDGLASDWLTKKLYWTDNVSKRIEVISLETKYRKVLYWEDLDQPRGIAVDPTEGVMFWTDWGDYPKIERASMNGDPNSRKVIIEDNLYWPNSVAVDVRAKKLYWLDGKFCFIVVVNYDGSERRTLIDKGMHYTHAYPFALGLSDSKFFWSDWGTHSIYSIDRNDSDQFSDQIIQSNDQMPIFGIIVYDGNFQPHVPTPCDHNNGGCSHLCLLSTGPKKFSCACPTGIRLIDNQTCANEEENFLFLVQRSEISRVSLDTPDHTTLELPIRGIKHAIGIDVDPVEQYIYWTDQEALNMRRAKLDGTQAEIIISSDILQPDGIAVDWMSRNLYWCDMSTNRVEMARLHTNFRRVIIFENLEQPRAVVVHPQKGWLFWSDWDELNPKIERANLDGSERRVLVDSSIMWPNGLALDYENEKLYFGDAKTDKIEVIGTNGESRGIVVGEDLMHMFGLTVLGDYLYWTDWSKRTLESANKYSAHGNRTVILDQLPDMMGLKAVNRRMNISKNACTTNNANCAHFCFSKPDMKHICACQVEYELSENQKDCILPSSYLMMLSNNRISRLSISSANTDTVPINEMKFISALDVSTTDRRVYWADSRMKTISRNFINGSRVEKIVSYGLGSPESVAVDWLAGNLYWADTNLRRIEVVKLDGYYRRTLFWNNLHEPRNLVVDPRVGLMFWTEKAHNFGAIVKASMDGSNRRFIVEGLGRVNGLTIDYTRRYLYWTHNLHDQAYIEQCDDHGLSRQIVFKRNSIELHSITQNADFLFYSENNAIMQLHKFKGNESRVYKHTSLITDVRVVDSAKQGGWNQCAVNNGDCKYLCLVRPGFESHSTDFECACPTHYTMRGNSCYPPDQFLLLSHRNAVYRLTTNTNECPDFPLPISGLKGVQAVEYDSAAKKVYWIDGKTSSIRRSADDDSNNEMLMGPNVDPYFYDIAIEPFSKVLFWSSLTTNSINATRLDNFSIGCVFEGKNDEKPRNIALYPERGLIFWTDAGKNPRVVQSRLNGDDQQNIEIENRLADALTVDRRSSLLYITFDGRLFEYNLATRYGRILIDVGSEKVLSLAVARSFLYWVSRNGTSVRIERVSVNVNTVSERTIIIKQSSHVTDLISVDPLDDAYPSHPCSVINNHGNCSHLCLPSTDDLDEAECGCPIHLQLGEDGRTCLLPLPTTVPGPPAEQTTCKLDNSSRMCDGAWDCVDGSDESPELCQSDKPVYLNDKNENYSFSFLFAFVILVCIAVFVAYYFLKQKYRDLAETKHDSAVMRPLASISTGAVCQPVTNGISMSSVPCSVGNGHASSVISGYQHSHLTSLSSSSSMVHFPLNPPPSPTTTTMQQDECSCCGGYRDPMPTPCSTDVCDSEASYPRVRMYVPDRTGRNRSRRHNRYHQHAHQPLQQQQSDNDYQDSLGTYRSPEDLKLAPPPPPPTPSNSVRYDPGSFQ